MSETAESVTERVAAPIWRRLAAIAYDSILLAAMFFVVTAIVVAVHRGSVAPFALRLLLAGTAWLYVAWCWVHGGQTVGLRAWRIAVVATDGNAVPWTAATLRFVAAFLPALPLVAVPFGLPLPAAAVAVAVLYLAGFLASRFDAARACWHDRLSGTRLVSRPRW